MKKIAVPADNGLVSAHFGHCPSFEVFEVDEVAGAVLSRSSQPAPAHEPGKIPRWLEELGVDVVLSGGMGRKALELFHEVGIEAVVGVGPMSVDEAVQGYLKGLLRLQGNACDH
jgi:predicted Fe-Mo cluster-binding NifX family protein